MRRRRVLAGDEHFEPGLFETLANRRVFRGFAVLDLAAGKLPLARECHACGPQPDEKSTVVFDDRDGDGRAPGAARQQECAHFFFNSSVNRPGEPMML